MLLTSMLPAQLDLWYRRIAPRRPARSALRLRVGSPNGQLRAQSAESGDSAATARPLNCGLADDELVSAAPGHFPRGPGVALAGWAATEAVRPTGETASDLLFLCRDDRI